MLGMISKLLQKFGGVVPAEELMTAATGEALALRFGGNYPEIQKVYAHNLEKQFVEEYLFPPLERIGLAASKDEQLLAFRKEVVELIEKEAINYFVIEGNTEVDLEKGINSNLDENVKNYFMSLLDEPMPFEDIWKYHYGSYLMANTAKHIIIEVCKKIENAKENGWEEYYTDMYRPYIESKIKNDAQNHSAVDDDPINEMMFMVTSKKIPEIKEGILAGAVFDYDSEAEEEKRKKEEEEQVAKENAKKRPKKRMASKTEVSELGELLNEWYHKYNDGKVFCLLDQPSNNPSGFLIVTTAIILRSLYECIQEEKEAQKTIKEVIWTFLKNNVPAELEEEGEDSYASISIDNQTYLIDEAGDDGWITGFILPATIVLYNLDWSKIPEEHQKEIIDESIKLIDDVSKIDAGTKAIFGWDVKVEGIFESLGKS